jgi:integrase/recombinase XerD
VTDTAAARVSGRYRPPLLTGKPQRPVRRALRVKTVEALPRPLSMSTYQRLLAATVTRRDRAILELMFEGGLRPGEVLGLHLADVAYGRRRVVVRHRAHHPRGVRQKSRRERVVDLWEDRAPPAINDYVMHERPAGAVSPFVFLVGRGPRRGEPLSYDALVRMFSRAAQRRPSRQGVM